jgi:hypothetical protein
MLSAYFGKRAIAFLTIMRLIQQGRKLMQNANLIMRQFAIFTISLMMVSTLSNVVGQQSRTSRTRSKTIKFAGGETTVEFGGHTDLVTVKNAKGNVTSESWCDSGTFDAYLTLFTKLKESAGRSDKAAVVKLVAYPLRVNGKNSMTYRDEVVLLKAYNKVFTPQVLDRIQRAEPAAVFCRNGLGMLGDGVVWARASKGMAKIEVINP